MTLRSTAAIVSGLLAMQFITSARAADYSAAFSTDLNVSHNDNIRLAQDEKTAVTKYRLAPELTFGFHTETTKLDLDTAADFNKYDKSEFDSNDVRLALSFSRQLERSSLGLDAHYVRNSTLTSELLTSGRIGSVADRAEQYSVTPNYSYAITESNLIQVSGTYTQQNYENNSYIGYNDVSGELDWIHLLSNRIKLVGSYTYSEYQSEDIVLAVPATPLLAVFGFSTGYFGKQSYAPQTKSTGGQVGLDYQWSEQSFFKVRVGRSRNNTSYSITDPNQICTDPIYLQLVAAYGSYIGGACNLPDTNGSQSNAELDWRWSNERQAFGINGSKAILPTSNGYAVDSTQLGANWNYQLSEFNSVSAIVSAARNRAINKDNPLQDVSIADRDYGTATLQYQRHLSEAWLIEASFQYSRQKYTHIDYQANSSTYAIGLSYKPRQWHWSK